MMKPSTKRWNTNHPEKMKEYYFNYHRRLKLKCLTHYGGNPPKCSCGIFDIDVLTIDHINDGGTKHRKEIGCFGYHFYHWLIKNNFPDGYRVLCFNCNWKKQIMKVRENFVTTR